MRRISAVVALAVAALGTFAAASPAAATEPPKPIPIVSDCLTDWYVNPDEGGADPKQGDRRPTQTPDGLLFSGNMLVHHEANIPIADLEPGTYVANPAPSLSSFFSVEVINADLSGYATLRWDPTLGQWNIGGTSHWDDDPEELVKAHNKGTTVFSFGVGYVNTPNNGTPTTVSSITFAGKTYDLTCKPRQEPEPTTTTTAGALANTGVNLTAVLLVAAVLLVGGIGALVLARSRRTS